MNDMIFKTTAFY